MLLKFPRFLSSTIFPLKILPTFFSTLIPLIILSTFFNSYVPYILQTTIKNNTCKYLSVLYLLQGELHLLSSYFSFYNLHVDMFLGIAKLENLVFVKFFVHANLVFVLCVLQHELICMICFKLIVHEFLPKISYSKNIFQHCRPVFP